MQVQNSVLTAMQQVTPQFGHEGPAKPPTIDQDQVLLTTAPYDQGSGCQRSTTMGWWLGVFFLINGTWVSGDQLDGWSSRKYLTSDECEIRRSFAEHQTSLYPPDIPSRWLCNYGAPPSPPPVVAFTLRRFDGSSR
jgi:hypothetical protein